MDSISTSYSPEETLSMSRAGARARFLSRSLLLSCSLVFPLLPSLSLSVSVALFLSLSRLSSLSPSLYLLSIPLSLIPEP